MKRNNLMFMAMAAIAAVALVSCNKAEIDSPNVSGKAGDLVISAYAPETAKAALVSEDDHYAMTWETTDKVKLVNAGTAYESSAISISGDKKKAEFTFEGAAGISGKFDIFSPSSQVSLSGSDVKLTVRQSQASKVTGVNTADYIIMGSGETPNLNVHFKHLVCYVKMTVKGLLPNEAVNSVNVQAYGSVMAGDITFDESGAPVYSGHGNDKDKDNIYVGAWSIGKANASGELTVWFATKPFTLAAGKKFTVLVKQNQPDPDNPGKNKEVTIYDFSSTAAQDVVFEAGKVVVLPVRIPTVKPMITFETNGGTPVDAQILEPGEKVNESLTKTTNYAHGLYEGNVDPYGLFDGWYKDKSLSEPFDFNVAPEASMTLYAKWKSADPTPLKTKLNEAFPYVSEQTGTDYTYIMTADENVDAGSLTLKTNANAVLKVVGAISERKIKQTWGNCYVLNISAGKVILGENVTLTGTSFQKSSVVELVGQFVMEQGSKIANTVHDATSKGGSCRGAVHVNGDNAVFTMNGGEIYGCNVTVVPKPDDPEVGGQNYFAGIVSINKGKFVMNGGKIHDNKISAAHKVVLGGGVAMSPARQFTKTGGEIYDNTAVNTAETDGKFIGQQAVIGSASNLWWVYKIDDNIDSSLNLDVSNIGENNPAPAPWIRIPNN